MAKEFYQYIQLPSKASQTLENYAKSPAVAFLKYAIDAKDASCMCQNKFQKKKDGNYHKDAEDSLHVINAGLLAAIMGNFETYQKYLFAQMYEYSIYLNKFDISHFCKMIKHGSDDIDLSLLKVSAYRDNPMGVGLILAYQLNGWQTPSVISTYFDAFGLRGRDGKAAAIYTPENKKDLSILWQMRHSIVHTAGVITIPDSQKISQLNKLGNKDIVLDKEFIPTVARKMHKIVKSSVQRLGDAYMLNLRSDVDNSVKKRIEDIFEVKSSIPSWLK